MVLDKHTMICITGGHVTPAVAVIEEIKRRHPQWNLLFIGRRRAFEGVRSPAHEERRMRALEVPFHELTTGRLSRTWSPFTFLSILKVPIGIIHAFLMLIRERPSMILSFGGYVALPVVLSAWVLRIPIITHEQSESLGLANRIIALFARRILMARMTGMPMRRALFHPPASPSFPIDTKHPIVYVTGGSTGAQTLNDLIFPSVAALVETYTVIHQTGSGDYIKAEQLKAQLPGGVRGRYIIADYFDDTDVAWIYRHSTLLVGRSGANTVAEAAALGVPALFIPLPWAAGNEQSQNAQKLADKGMSLVRAQHTLTAHSLLVSIGTMVRAMHRYKRAAQSVAAQYPRHAAAKVVEEIERSIPSSS